MWKILVILLVVSLPEAAFAEDSHDFRNVYWGMSVEEVKKSENSKPDYEEKNIVGYKSVINGKNVLLGYFFSDGKLYMARYVLDETFSNSTDYYYSFYVPIKQFLIDKYGNPPEDRHLWKNNTYKNNSEHFGLALSLGHYAEYAKWETAKTTITEYIAGNNLKITPGIEYTSKELAPAKEAVDKKKTLGNL